MIQLRVSLQALLKNGKKEANFTKGEFHVDNRNKNITVFCVNENLVVFWSMKDIMSGRTESSEVRQMNKRLIKSEFRNNRNDLLTIFEDEVKLFKNDS